MTERVGNESKKEQIKGADHLLLFILITLINITYLIFFNNNHCYYEILILFVCENLHVWLLQLNQNFTKPSSS